MLTLKLFSHPGRTFPGFSRFLYMYLLYIFKLSSLVIAEIFNDSVIHYIASLLSIIFCTFTKDDSSPMMTKMLNRKGPSTKSCGLPRWLSDKESASNAVDKRDTGSIPGSGRSPGVENGNSLQYSCLENSTDRGACGLESMELQSQT